MEFEKFEDVKCLKPDLQKIQDQFESLTKALKEAKDAKAAAKVLYEEFNLSDEVNTQAEIAQIRHTIDIRDKYYADLVDYYDQMGPLMEQYENEFEKTCATTPLRKDLEKIFGSYFFEKIDIGLKTFSPEIIPELQEENALGSRYNNLMGSAKGNFRGEMLPITKFDPLMASTDREVRKDAAEGYWAFFATHEAELADIYDKMVKVRTKIAKKLGFDNFLPLGYYRLGRADWGPEDVAKYREQVLKQIVPVAQDLYKEQAQRLGYKDMKFYDYKLQFLNGNPTPKGNPDELVQAASKMYKEMSPVASKYFDFMVSHHMMDLVSKDGKIPGGYMEYLPAIHSSFIFSNFNGSSGDVDVLTHEFGHSLQGFLAGDIKEPSLRAPGYECDEMHSMSMEFFAYPWMKNIFGDQEAKYRDTHLVEDIEFIPYGVSVDEFQTFGYSHPEASHEERKAAWRDIEKKYRPHLSFKEDNPFLESGGWWMRQLHIFVDPLYYIDYTIAQVAAFEFFLESTKDFKKAFDKYLAFDRLGGTLPYKALLKKAGIGNPMEPTIIPSLIPDLRKYLASFDDKKM